MSRAQCLECEDIIESKHRHDFVKCKCGKSFIDGGDDYLRGGGYLIPVLDALDEDIFEDAELTEEDLHDFNLGYQAGTLDERDRIIELLDKSLGHVDWEDLIALIKGEQNGAN